MEYILNEQFVITNEEAVKDEIFSITGEKTELEEIATHILTGNRTIFFLDKNLKIKSEGDKEIRLVWLDTGKKTSTGEPIMISLVKRDGYFRGYFTGAPYYLVNGMCHRNPQQERTLKANLGKFTEKYRTYNEGLSKTEIKQREELPKNIEEKPYIKQEGKFSNVTEEIYEQLLFPNWKSIRGLDRYIKIIGARVKQLIVQEKNEYYVANKIQSVIINTGMMNLFGADFQILYRYYEKYQTYIAECVIHSKQDFLDNGFTKEQASIEIKPINFFDEGTDRFEPEMTDFDINQSCLMHIIKERKGRFPESIRCQNEAKIANQFICALKRGVKMQQRDNSFAKASYSGRSGNISWLMPLHIEASLGESPELVMVIRKTGNFYEVKTILPFDEEMQDRITALSLYNKVWC